MKELILIGAGGFGREVAWLIERINSVEKKWNIKGYVDDNPQCDQSYLRYPLLGNMEWLQKYHEDVDAVCTIANPSVREKIINALSGNEHILFPSVIDPSVMLGCNNNIGQGCIICANTVVTVNTEINDFTIINLSCTIGHEAHLHKFCTLYPTVNVSGNVVIFDKTEIGTGSQIIQQISIGSNTIIGAGSIVIRNIPSNCTAVGVPAKVIKQR